MEVEIKNGVLRKHTLSPGEHSITLPVGVTSIGAYAFWRCESLTSITFPAGVTSIGKCAFRDCSALAEITVPVGVTIIEEYAFWECRSLRSIRLPPGVTSIGEAVFCGCVSLTSITLPSGVTSIGSGAFWNCKALTSITLPASVRSIGIRAFQHCISLRLIALPAGVTQIGRLAFSKDLEENQVRGILAIAPEARIVLQATVSKRVFVAWAVGAGSRYLGFRKNKALSLSRLTSILRLIDSFSGGYQFRSQVANSTERYLKSDESGEKERLGDSAPWCSLS